MSYNSLSSPPPQIFSDLRSLEILFLHGHHFTTLPQSVFSGLSSLVHLDLSMNRLSTLPSNLIADATGLGILPLNDNELEELPDPPEKPLFTSYGGEETLAAHHGYKLTRSSGLPVTVQ